jgi:CBS domain-containing protein/anti-sigma regulatory factor (Ser/Thr protein kinase)
MSDGEITKLQELIYTLRVEAVMAPDVITVGPDMSMRELKDLMRAKRISGAPVMDSGRMVGLVSLAQVIDCLERGALDDAVSRHMETQVRTVFSDAYVAELVNNMGRKGIGRVPVLDRNMNLVGIVTTGTLMQSLLKEMDTSFKKSEEERLHTYRASHIFEDVMSDDTSLVLRFVVNDKDFNNAGKASSSIKKSLQRLSVRPNFVRRVAVAVYEAEMNLVIHTDVGGELEVVVKKNRLRVSAIDHGPGIDDVGKVLEPGFSTAPEWIRDMGFGAGMGLANIKRCSDLMRLISEPGAGTRLDMYFHFHEPSVAAGLNSSSQRPGRGSPKR